MIQNVCVQMGMTGALVFLFGFWFCVFLRNNKENNPKVLRIEEVVKLRLCPSDVQLARSER